MCKVNDLWIEISRLKCHRPRDKLEALLGLIATRPESR